MNHWQRTQLIEDLESSTPLIGWLTQRRAARRLAKDNTNRSTLALAQAALNHPDSAVRKIARRAIEKVNNQAGINAVCQVWRETRSPWLANLITIQGWVASKPDDLRVLSALQANQIEQLIQSKAGLVTALVQVAAEDKDPYLLQHAHNALAQVQKPAQIDALWSAWFKKRLPFLEEILLDKNVPARKPESIRLVSILKTGKAEIIYNLSAEMVPFMLHLAHDNDRHLSKAAQGVLENLSEEDARQTLCQQVIEPEASITEDGIVSNPIADNSIAKKITRNKGYLPQKALPKALFLLLTEQWEAYHALDFDQRLLQISYQAASATLHKRILDAIRQGGQTQLLSAIAGKDFRSQVSTLSNSEASTLVQILADSQMWQKLWDSLPGLPYPAALQAMRSLTSNNWQPQDPGEQEYFFRLASLAQDEIEEMPVKINAAIPPAILRVKIHLRKGRLNDLCFSPQRSTLAIAASNRKIILWDLLNGQIQQMISGFSRSVGQVTYSRDGRLVSAERSLKSDDPCQIYMHEGEQNQPLYRLTGPVTALVPWQMSGVLATGRDGSLNLLNLNQGNPLVKSLRLETWPRGVSLSPDESYALVWGKTTAIVSLPGLEITGHLQPAELDQRIPRQACVLPKQNQLCLGFSDGSLKIYKLPEITPFLPSPPEHKSSILAIETLSETPTWLSASIQGEICFHAWPDPKSHRRYNLTPERISALRISPDGVSLATCDQASNLLLWDLRPLQIPQLIEDPLGLGTTTHLSALQGLLALQNLLRPVHNALEFIHTLLHFRFRYAVELSQAAEIQAGEFDIDLS